MKKLLGIILIVLGIVITFAPLFVEAQQMIEKCTLRHDITIAGTPHNKGDVVYYKDEGVFCVMDALLTATDWIFAIVLSIAIIFIIWGAFSLITAGGSSEKAVKGRNYIVYAVVGFVVALLAKAIPAIAAWFLGG